MKKREFNGKKYIFAGSIILPFGTSKEKAKKTLNMFKENTKTILRLRKNIKEKNIPIRSVRFKDKDGYVGYNIYANI